MLGKLGNTGNTSAPHLHFHLMDGTSVLGSSGLPYMTDSFSLAGRILVADFEKAEGIGADWRRGMLASPEFKKNAFPWIWTS